MVDRNDHSRKWLQLDALGALLSASLHALIIIYFGHVIGMPDGVLMLLGILACCFALFDSMALLQDRFSSSFCLAIIAKVNVLYCLLSLVLLIYHRDSLTTIGTLFFTLEIIIVGVLAAWELKVADP